ncbi:MAG: hypothetical protein OZ923_06470 [Comamonadaceae bacterium]|nr:hypothetical protein [Burkholderiales bacterium]MEB2348239.1 hypothetical protein [Comamonadaceae bacterium]
MHRWKLSLLASAAALATGLYVGDASALALGRITVQSALGEPLRAQITLAQITPAEADSLRVSIASPDAFRAQGLEYSRTVNDIRLQLQRRANGSAVLELTSNGAINDPFVDLVIDAAWSAGHIVRSYTMLFDPPGLRPAPATVAVAPQVETPVRAAPRAAPTPSPAPAPARAVTRAPAPAPVAKAQAAAPAPAAAPATPGTVTVRAGDTAGGIASRHRPGGISLDQMLVAMVRANPDAFVDGNVNRLRTGAVLQIPDKGAAGATAAPEARKIIAAQSRDFNEFRRRLAGAAPAAKVAQAERSDSGKVQTQVAESKPEATSADKLTLTHGDAATTDQATAQSRQTGQSAARMAELSKNISDLKELSNDSAAAPAGTPPAEPAAGVPVSPPATPASDTAPAAAQSAAPAPIADAPAGPAAAEPSATPATSATAPANGASAPAPAASADAATPEDAGMLGFFKDQPLAAGGVLVLLLALLGLAGRRMAQRRREQEGPETILSDPHTRTDSFFAASGGQEVDTSSSELSTESSTSVLYSPSQMDPNDGVDPIAEADVYMAYGKDPQAEEILKEAAVHHPGRVAIPAKLAEIYAKRQDRAALQTAARQVLDLTQGNGPEWERVRELGHALDADNPLYQAVNTAAPVDTVATSAPDAGPDSELPAFDIDLDLDPPEPAAAPTITPPGAFAAAAATAAATTLHHEPPGVEVTPPGSEEAPTAGAPLSVDAPSPPPGAALDFGAAGFALSDLPASAPVPLTSAATEPAPLEFDLSGLSLDLDTPPATGSAPLTESPLDDPDTIIDTSLPDDPLSTKLALAEEFKTIGDSEGARTLIEEVLAEATGDLKAQARRMLSSLG